MALDYFENATKILDTIVETQSENIERAASTAADSIERTNLVHLFGSGLAVLPVLDVFPRIGGFVGFHPLPDPRLMWQGVIGGGMRELQWIENAEGYICNFLQSYELKREDTLILYSHSGLNAVPVEAAMYAKDIGMKVIAVTSSDSFNSHTATHSSGYKLGDLADVLIDNCSPAEDAVVPLEGYLQKTGATSTLAFIYITQSLVTETAKELKRRGYRMDILAAPCVEELPEDNNQKVFARYTEIVKRNKML